MGNRKGPSDKEQEQWRMYKGQEARVKRTRDTCQDTRERENGQERDKGTKGQRIREILGNAKWERGKAFLLVELA